MSATFALPYPAFCVGRATAAGATAFTQPLFPCPGPGQQAIYAVDGHGSPNWLGQGVLHVTRVIYTTGTTLHQLGLMRPLNWTYFSAAVPKNTTAVTLASDPGLYSTSYKYPTPGNATPTLAADNVLAANDYVMYQLADGAWQVDTVASGTFAGGNVVLTTGTPNRTGATIAANSPLFWFGVVGDTDPATGLPHFQWDTTASTTNEKFDDGSAGVFFNCLRPGDPALFYSPNTTAAGKLTSISGFYAAK